jgi:hypothetical protein
VVRLRARLAEHAPARSEAGIVFLT